VLKFFETSTRNLVEYGAAAGVGHHIALSVVGTDRLLGCTETGRAPQTRFHQSTIGRSFLSK
jgi:hypothetical protein